MTIEVHVQARVESGGLADFNEAVRRYQDYARSHGYAVARVLFGLAGKMNTVRLVYTYEDLSAYEAHEVQTLTDRGYAEVAQQMRLVDGSVRYEVYRQI
jgi:quinol monooxygenase YgiN